MSGKNTKEEKDKLINKLEYLELDLDHMPDFLLDHINLDFRPSKTYSEENNYKVYRYLDVMNIEILLTQANRLDMLEQKYSLSAPLGIYLNPKKEQDIDKYSTFMQMLKDMQPLEIEDIEKEQKEFKKISPFKVRFHKNYLWQVYYSEYTDKYFMLVPTKETNQSAFFYLLKKQIESFTNKKTNQIYVPICNAEYSGEMLRGSEIEDIENYLWLFTKQWPVVHEVYDINNKMSIQIVGKTKVYEEIISSYNIKLNTKQEAIKFYKLVKALFVLQTELPSEYKFDVRINEKNGIDFYYKNNKIIYDELAIFIKEQFEILKENAQKVIEELEQIKNKKEKLMELLNEKQLEYLDKEKQITTFIECRRTVIGKIRYYFKIKKKDNSNFNNKIGKKPNKKKGKVEKEKTNISSQLPSKELYTIEDLIKSYKIYNDNKKGLKNDRLDINALGNRISMIEMRTENAQLYLKEIDKHKKNIFEFLKFTKKDDILALNEAQEEKEEESARKLERSFRLEEDFEDFGNQIDKIEREQLNQKECNSIFLANTELLKDINIIYGYYTRKKKDIKLTKQERELLDKSLQVLKKKSIEEKLLFKSEDFDIFGSIEQDKTKIQLLNGKKHREHKRNMYRILDITKNTTIDDYIKILIDIIEKIQNSFKKIISPVCLPVYISNKKDLPLKGFHIYYLNPSSAVNQFDEKEIYLKRINIKSDQNILFFSNIIYYDNNNKTLPLGMEISDQVLIDNKSMKLELVKQQEILINEEQNYAVNIKKIYIQEYNIM